MNVLLILKARVKLFGLGQWGGIEAQTSLELLDPVASTSTERELQPGTTTPGPWLNAEKCSLGEGRFTD